MRHHQRVDPNVTLVRRATVVTFVGSDSDGPCVALSVEYAAPLRCTMLGVIALEDLDCYRRAEVALKREGSREVAGGTKPDLDLGDSLSLLQ